MNELVWKRSSHCGESGQCVETAEHGGDILIRSSRAPDTFLIFTREEWQTHIQGVLAGDFGDGMV